VTSVVGLIAVLPVLVGGTRLDTFSFGMFCHLLAVSGAHRTHVFVLNEGCVLLGVCLFVCLFFVGRFC